MGSSSRHTSDDLFRYSKDVVLKKLYEDDELVVLVAPNEHQLKEIILNLLRDQPRTVRELHEILSGLASEDKIRYALNKLIEEGLVEGDDDGRYYALYV